MKIARLLTVAAALLFTALQAQSATVAYWDFENSTETATTPTDGQPFYSGTSGGAAGSADIANNIIMYGWSTSAGPQFTSDNLWYNGFAADFLSSNRDGYVWDSTLTLWQPTNWTIECTVELEDINGWRGFIGKRGSSHGIPESDMYIQKEAASTNNHIRLSFSTVAGERVIIDATNVSVQVGQWYGVAAVSDGTSASLYVDAGSGYQLGGTYTYTNTVVASNILSIASGDWIFGCGWYNGELGDHLNGKLDNVRFSDSALTPAEFIPVPIDPFVITYGPTETSTNTSQTLEATIVELDSDFSSAALSLNGAVVANNNTPSLDGTNTVSYPATLAVGTHTGSVVVVGINPSVTVTSTWTFVVQQLPFTTITPSPTGWTTNDSPTLSAEVIESFSIVDSAQMFLNGAEVSPVNVDRSLAPTTTVSYAASGLGIGIYTGKVVVVGSPNGVYTNEWTFQVVSDPNKPASLLHHWDFEEGGGTSVNDIVGGAHGSVINTNFAWVNGGLNLLGGGNSGMYDQQLSTGTNVVGSYVDLPNGLVAALPGAVTFEATYIVTDNTWWMRVWDMGTDSSHTENIVGTGAENIFLSTHSNSGVEGLRCSVATNSPGYNHEFSQMEDTANIEDRVGVLTHVVWIYDTDAGFAKLYVNGVLVDAEAYAPGVAFPLSSFSGLDNNNWIGRAQYPDPMLNGKVYDFRIYSGVMTAAEAAARYADVLNSAGPTVDPDIQSIVVAGGSATITWTSESGATYNILSKDALTDSWTTNKSGIASAGDGTTSDSVTAGADAEFFQIEGE